MIRDITERKRAVEKLQASEVRYRRLFEAANDGVIILSADTGEIEEVNPFLIEILGYSREELIGKELWEIGLFKDIFANREAFFKLQKDGHIRYENLPLKTKQGHAIWVEFVSNTYISYGKTVIQCNIRDITERHNAAAELQKVEKAYHDIVENTHEGIWLTDKNSRTILVNKRFSEIFGYSPGEMAEKSIPDLIDEDWKTFSKAKHAERLKGIADNFDMVFRTKSGNKIWINVNASASMGENGEYLNGVAMLTDITERKENEETIAKGEKQLAFDKSNLGALINNTNDLMWSVDRDFNLITANKPFNDMCMANFGRIIVPKSSVLSVSYTPEMASHYKQLYNRAFAGESFTETDHFEIPVEFWTDISYYPIHKGDEIIGTACSSRDVTERKRNERKVLELNENLEKRVSERTMEVTHAYKDLEAFASTVSHDLRAPARAINGFAKLIKQQFGDNMQVKEKELFGFIEDGGNRMCAMIDDLLKLARYGNEQLKLEPVNMERLINGIWLNISRSTAHNAILELKGLPTVNVDMSMMQQVVVNLLSNAIKYSSKKDKPVVTIWCEKTEGHFTFYFKDNGAGFDMKNYDRLFGAFQRLHSMKDFEGTGVGLSLVKRIIEKHGGEVGAEGKVGEGAVFWFRLPRE